MEVILLQDVGRLGKAGEVRRVADGYARNYLIPRQLALLATEGARKKTAERLAAGARRETSTIAQAEAQAADLEDVKLVFKARASESGRLYGSVTSANIVEQLHEELGALVDKRRVLLKEPIKEVGESRIDIVLSSDVTITVTVIVEPETA